MLIDFIYNIYVNRFNDFYLNIIFRMESNLKRYNFRNINIIEV